MQECQAHFFQRCELALVEERVAEIARVWMCVLWEVGLVESGSWVQR